MNGWRCPRCGSDDLDVQVAAWARLDQLPTGSETLVDVEFQTMTDEAKCGDHEWDEDSPMACRSCSHAGFARTFVWSKPPRGCLGVAEGWFQDD